MRQQHFYKKMMKRLPLLLLVLTRLNANAWITDTRASRSTHCCLQMTAASTSVTENILSDGAGRINRVLAECIWQWEHLKREQENLPPLAYSVRSGIRLVEEAVSKGFKNDQQKQDLVQEGLSALLDAMSKYEGNDSDGFETYARQHIQQALSTAYYQDTHFVRVPESMLQVVNEARAVKKKLFKEMQQEPTLKDIAERMQIPPMQLADCLRWTARPSTVVSVDSINKRSQQEERIDRFQDIPDTAELSEEQGLTDRIRDNIGKLLTSALDDMELKVVKMSFGLEFGEPLPAEEIALELKIEADEVSRIREHALDKLRKAYLGRIPNLALQARMNNYR
jgi:RNA polymerase sigma factor for flagellar operon FliA